MGQHFEVYAIRYATREARSGEHFYGGDPHDALMPMDYFVWAAVSAEHTVVVDAGFTAEVAAKRGREYLRCPTEGLREIGVDCERVSWVILTHLHYDHVGNLEKFPEATFVVQEEEMAFWTGRYAGREHFRHTVEMKDVIQLVHENFEGRAAGGEGRDGEGQIRPRLRRNTLLREHRGGPPFQHRARPVTDVWRLRPRAFARRLTGPRNPGPRPTSNATVPASKERTGGRGRPHRLRTTAGLAGYRIP
jgi:hypothetical protein